MITIDKDLQKRLDYQMGKVDHYTAKFLNTRQQHGLRLKQAEGQ